MRSISARPLTGLVALVSLCFLTAAKGAGCRHEPRVEPAEPCPGGGRPIEVCEPDAFTADGTLVHGECSIECEPEGCPEGTRETWICDGPAPLCHDADCAAESGAVVCEGDGCAPPSPPVECHRACVPVDECPAGSHLEWQCGGKAGDTVVAHDGTEPGAAPPEDCQPVCVPDTCPPGYEEHVTCGPRTAEDVAHPVEPCHVECVLAACPPGTHEVWDCTGPQPDCPPDADCPAACTRHCVEGGCG